jgi:hypothetical protein
LSHLTKKLPSKTVIEGKDRGKDRSDGKMRKRRKQLLDVLKERREYWKLEEEALDRTVWRTDFGKGYKPVVRLARE